MSTQIFKKIKFCRTFEDLCKIININSKEYLNVEIIDYEYLVYNHNEISCLYYTDLNNNNIYRISNCSIGFLHFNGYLPESMRTDIINNVNSKKFFEQIHNIMFCQYMKFIELKYNNKIWYKLILNILNNDIAKHNIFNKRVLYAAKSTFNVRQQSLLDTINNIVDINSSEAIVERKHIFKISKKVIPHLGIFKIGSNTIGSHYYTSMCSFIYLKLNSKKYNNFISNIKQVFENIRLQIPELKIVFVISIIDADNLSFKLGSCILSMSSFIISNKLKAKDMSNIIFE